MREKILFSTLNLDFFDFTQESFIALSELEEPEEDEANGGVHKNQFKLILYSPKDQQIHTHKLSRNDLATIAQFICRGLDLNPGWVFRDENEDENLAENLQKSKETRERIKENFNKAMSKPE